MYFRPLADRTRWEGLIAASWTVLIDALLLYWAIHRTTDWLQFMLIFLVIISLPVVVYILYRTWAAFSLEYWIDRNAVTIRYANVRQIVPLAVIMRVIDGGVEELTQPRWYHWPLPHLRHAAAETLPNVVACATRPLSESLLLDTGNQVFAITPRHLAQFIEVLQENYRLGPATHLSVAEVRTGFFSRIFGRGAIGLILLGAGLVGVLALFGRLMIPFPTLPSPLPFRYTTDGLPEVVRDKTALFIIPAIGLLTWLVNGVWGAWMTFRSQPTGAYMLWGGAIIVQIFSLLALNSLLP
jgi:hypothetical protein